MRILLITLLIGFTYGFPEGESEGGKGPRKNLPLLRLQEFGSGGNPDLAIDDDEDYNYIEEQLLDPSTPRVLDLPTPTPSFIYESDLIIATETLAISSMMTTTTATPTPALPILPLSTSLTSSMVVGGGGFGGVSSHQHHHHHHQPSSSLVNTNINNNNNNEWLHIGSGDSIDINPTPALDLSSPAPTSAVAFSPSPPRISTSSNSNSNNNNEPPRVLKSIGKIGLQGGSFHKQRLDEHFSDDHDLNLRYVLDTPFKWIYIRGNHLYMLPTVEDVSEYTFNLTAEDSEGQSVSTALIVSVRQPSKSRLWFFHYAFSFPSFPDWREIVHRNMSQGDPKNFIVKKVTTDANLIHLEYVNETLLEYSRKCPIENISAVVDHYQRIYPDFEYVLTPRPGSICENQRSINVTSVSNNYPPSIKNQIDFLNFSNGELFVYKVRDDFCYDPEQGSTNNLDILLTDINHEPIPPDNWLQFDTKNREFFGIYVNGKTGAEVNTGNGGLNGGKYILICRDKYGKEASDVIDTWITTAEEQFNAEFSLHFTTNSFNPIQIRKFVEKIATLFSSTPSQIKIKSYTVDNSIVHFTWYNKSNPGEKEITQLRKILFSNEGPVDKKVVELFSPEFTITGGNVVPIGKLIGEDTVFHFPNINNVPTDLEGGKAVEGDMDDTINIDTSNYSNYLVTYLIPSVLIAVMVLLSLIIACLLSRKKKLPGDANEIRKVGGGVPVIFQDELEVEHPLLHSNSGTGSRSHHHQPSSAPLGQPPAPPGPGASSTGPNIHTPQQQQQQQPPPPPIHRAASATPPPHKYAHHPPPPGYKSVAKYEPPLPPVQYSSSSNKYHHNSNTGILPPPYVPP